VTQVSDVALPLADRLVFVPETRELDLLDSMLRAQGALTLRCPLVGIRDRADQAPVEAWLRRCIAEPFDDLILLTGEGLRRLHAAATRLDLGAALIAALRPARKVVRGPKPVRALRELGLDADLRAAEPTSDGVIATLSTLDLVGRRVGVQLYPDATHEKLLGFLNKAGAAVDAVIPYEYAPAAEDRQVSDAIARMVNGEVHAITFTSSPQIKRLLDVARDDGHEAALTEALGQMVVAAVGPVAAEALRSHGIRVDVVPEDSFFMKPLVQALARAAG
jgi:uroporphyrinogen-III synthase